jgi:CDP-diacylglycerol--serine O-phosphatidyltransferase
MKQIPNLFTLLNLAFGCTAIILILVPGESIATIEQGNLLIQFPEKIAWASYLIVAAAIVDFLDGFVARLLKAASEMGKQLDSLSDVVSFGVAPSMILFQLLRMSYLKESNAFDTPIVYFLPAILLACCAAWRLAKFNIDTRQTISFRGVPTPITGLVVAAFPLMLYSQSGGSDLLLNKWVIYTVIAVLSYLMVADFPIMSLKFKDYSYKSNKPKLLLAVLSLLFMVLFQWLAIPLIYITYVLLSLLLRKQIS